MYLIVSGYKYSDCFPIFPGSGTLGTGDVFYGPTKVGTILVGICVRRLCQSVKKRCLRRAQASIFGCGRRYCYTLYLDWSVRKDNQKLTKDVIVEGMWGHFPFNSWRYTFLSAQILVYMPTVDL
uniref:Uncharacterized protein n=1 Tax=Trypanosoma congolense (strain IL3000) TaxID=1068625 RepID=G0V073_TRYCI|nr:hypothetical protein, unlikely [Trypanosoma congolense IL3000]